MESNEIISKLWSNIDNVIINLLSVVIGGAGLLGALTKFHTRELYASFFVENPFAVKRDHIDTPISYIFTLVTLLGLLIQVISEIFGQNVPDRLHSATFYVYFFVFLIILMILPTIGLIRLGKRIAKKKWFPYVI